MRLLEAMADRNGPAIVEAAAAVRHGVDDGDIKYLVEAEMYGHLLQGNPAANINLWRTLPIDIQKDVINNLPIRLMLAHSGWTPDRLE